MDIKIRILKSTPDTAFDSETITELSHRVEYQILSYSSKYMWFLDVDHFRWIWSKPDGGTFSKRPLLLRLIYAYFLERLLTLRWLCQSARCGSRSINNFETLFIDKCLPLYYYLSLFRPLIFNSLFGGCLFFLWFQFGRSLREKGALNIICFDGRFPNSLRIYLIKEWAQVFEVICVI